MTPFLRCTVGVAVLVGSLAPAAAWADDTKAAAKADQRLLLLADVDKRLDHISTALMKPFDAWIVAERLGDQKEISAVVFRLELPDGMLLIGEEVHDQSLIVLGTPKTGMHVTFRCQTKELLTAMRLRLVATQPLAEAKVRLLPEPQGNFRGVVSCEQEGFATLGCDEQALTVTAR